MKTLLSFLVLLFASIAITAQKPDFRYDRFKDQTFVESASMGFKIDANFVGMRLSMNVITAFPGQSLVQAPNEYVLVIHSASHDWMFLRSSDLYAIADGQRMSIGRARRSSNVGRGYVTEDLYYSLSQDDLAKLAAAKSVEMKIGVAEVAVKEKDLQAFGYFRDAIVNGLLAKPKS